MSNHGVIDKVDKQEALASLPAELSRRNLQQQIAALLARRRQKVVVLDDDPTGTQTVHGVNVVTRWSLDTLVTQMQGPERTFFILTNSRSLPESEAVDLTTQVVNLLCEASRRTKTDFSLVSRSDSTLRGHFPAEVTAAMRVMEARLQKTYHAQVLIPAFFEGGRYTFADTHWVTEGEKLIPAGETEFARDPAFCYQSSNLVDWVVEKTNGLVSEKDVVTIPVQLIRTEGPEGILAVLENVPAQATVVCNAVSYSDMEALVVAFLLAEERGLNYLYRTAASFVPVYGGVELWPPLTEGQLSKTVSRGRECAAGLIVVGSHVQRTTVQLRTLLKSRSLAEVELRVSELFEENRRRVEMARVTRFVDENLRSGRDTVVFTSREVMRAGGGSAYLKVGETVSKCLVGLVKSLSVCPQFLIAKGGITSSDLVTRALTSQTARVLGQLIPGVPIWELEPPSRFPGLPYVVFPGNVGDETGLLASYDRLKKTIEPNH